MMNQTGMQQPANNMQPQIVNPTMNQVGMQQPAQPQPVVQQPMQQPVQPQMAPQNPIICNLKWG